MNIGRVKFIKVATFILSLLFYLIYILNINYSLLDDGYKITIILPIVFIFCFYALLFEPVVRYRTPYLIMFCCIAFVRYIVLSIVTINNGNYNGISGLEPSSYNLMISGLLMCWELIITSVLINIYSKRKLNRRLNDKRKILSESNIIIYLIFVFITIILLILVTEARKGISFFGTINRSINDEIGSLLVLGIRECFINAKYFLLFSVIIILSRRKDYEFSKNIFLNYIFVGIVCIVIIGLRIGTNRKKMLADVIGALVIMWSLFPKYKRTTSLGLAIAAITLVSITTVFRGMTSSVGMFFSDYFNIDFLQQYFLGQYNIAISIEAKEYYSSIIDVKSYFLSFLRPLFIVGQIVEKINFIMPANIFDIRMSNGLNGLRRDQIIPMIGEGYILFGTILSPLISLISARIGILLDSIYLKSEKLEIIFIVSVLSFYLAQSMILNSTIILNHLSFRLSIYLPIVFIAYIFKRKDEKMLKKNFISN